MKMIGQTIRQRVESHVVDYAGSRLEELVTENGAFVIKFIATRWIETYRSFSPLKISETPALTWGTATYVTPLAFPLSSALYGRIGVVSEFDPSRWRVFDATKPQAQRAYVAWARAQPIHADLLLTVHSTQANHFLRNKFREEYEIDCVLFHPDQEAEIHTDRDHHVWMAATDWAGRKLIDSGMSRRFARARFTVLLDEEFELQDKIGLPVRRARREIERVTEKIPVHSCARVDKARNDPLLPVEIANHYKSNGFVHVFIVP